MIRRWPLRRRVAWVALVVLLCGVVASLRFRHQRTMRAAPELGCNGVDRDSMQLARVAIDTIASLRARGQRVQRFTRTPNGFEVRTEDSDPLSAHDGGLVAFDCAGRLTFLWLDGG